PSRGTRTAVSTEGQDPQVRKPGEGSAKDLEGAVRAGVVDAEKLVVELAGVQSSGDALNLRENVRLFVVAGQDDRDEWVGRARLPTLHLVAGGPRRTCLHVAGRVAWVCRSTSELTHGRGLDRGRVGWHCGVRARSRH